MVRGKHGAGLRQRLDTGGHTSRRVVCGIVIAALVVLLGYIFLPRSDISQWPSALSGHATQAEKPKGLSGQSAEVSVQGRELAARTVRELDQMKPRGSRFSQGEIDDIKRLIRDLKRQGRSGIAAICEFLQTGQDVNFVEYRGDSPPEYSTLRLAMIDLLGQIGGEEATEFMVGMLPTTTKPEEVAALARALETTAPRAYRADILTTVLTRFDQTLSSSVGQYRGLNHLFGVIEDYGDETLVPPLEGMSRSSPPAAAEISLMALLKLSDGAGIPSLVKMVNEMVADPSAYGTRFDMALRTLTQASRESPAAAEAFIKLTTTNRLSTPALAKVAALLGGTEYQLVTRRSADSSEDYTEISVNSSAPDTWSEAEIDQRLGLIDMILRSNPQPQAARALDEARDRLLAWKQEPRAGAGARH